MTDPTLASTTASSAHDSNIDDGPTKYRTLVIDSGPIIKLTGVSSLRHVAQTFYTVPAVIHEIRDAKARQHLQQLPFELQTRTPSPQSIQAVQDFARLTGDYNSLSTVDLQVLGLVYELEREGCHGSVEHIRTTPKRTVGVGKIQVLGDNNKKKQQQLLASSSGNDNPQQQQKVNNESKQEEEEEEEDIEYDEVNDSDDDEDDDDDDPPTSFFEEEPTVPTPPTATATSTPFAVEENPTQNSKTWAMLVNPTQASPAASIPPTSNEMKDYSNSMIADQAVHGTFGKMNISGGSAGASSTKDDGQFSDAEEEEDSGSQKEPENDTVEDDDEDEHLEKELQSDFPSLAASLHVPFEGEDDDRNNTNKEQNANHGDNTNPALTDEERKQQALRPVTKSGKLYNSFRGYGKLFQATKKPVQKKEEESTTEEDGLANPNQPQDISEDNRTSEVVKEGQSRIMGGMSMAGQEEDVEDDGEGWITCTRDIRSLQASGTLAPPKNPLDEANAKKLGPPISQRAACATTDFAMQNVILQMGLELLSVDGVKIRRLKNWVMRCGACFKVYTKNDDAGPHGMKRLFCERCGSDMLQRIAASVDGKTGRLRLHMSKKHKKSNRGTKFSLPKPGNGDRFQGDILLREDQLLMGAWNQKVKIRSGGKAKSAAQSMFGQDIATNVGCRASSMTADDIAVGFGRRNPNSAKGRERRGKKKKSSQKACGLRRYN